VLCFWIDDLRLLIEGVASGQQFKFSFFNLQFLSDLPPTSNLKPPTAEDSFSSLFSISSFLFPIFDLLFDKVFKIQHYFQDIPSAFLKGL